jgi:ABC-2 type transport system ATP-binding protein
VITVTSVTARAGGGFRRAASVISDVSFTWERGVLAILGAPADGTTALLEVLSGSARPKRGAASLGAGAPGASPLVVHVRLEPCLPDGLRVEEILALASTFRAQAAPDARAALEALGVAHLAARPSSSLTRAEARAVQLALAVRAQADVLLLEEPLTGLEPPAAGRAVAELRALASTTSIVLTTASVRDATQLADRVLLLTRGRLAEPPPATLHAFGGHASVVAVVAGEPDVTDAFVRALERMSVVTDVTATRYAGASARAPSTAVTAHGREPRALAEAVMRAAAATSAPIEAISTAASSLDALRGSLSAGLAPAPAASSPPEDP